MRRYLLIVGGKKASEEDIQKICSENSGDSGFIKGIVLNFSIIYTMLEKFLHPC
jgi:hypothetical protein